MDRSELAAQKSIRETQGRLGERWSTKKKGKGRRFAGGGLEDRYLRRRGRRRRWHPPEVAVCLAPVDARQRKPRRGRCRHFLFFLVANRYAGSGGIKIPSNAGREVSELWAGTRALAQYFAALEGGFRLSMRKPSKHVNCGVYDSNSRFRPSIPTSKRSLSFVGIHGNFILELPD